jgi:hypothetical protein
LLPVAGFLLAVALLDDIRSLGTPRASWAAVLLFSHLAVLTIACVLLQRPSGRGPDVAADRATAPAP